MASTSTKFGLVQKTAALPNTGPVLQASMWCSWGSVPPPGLKLGASRCDSLTLQQLVLPVRPAAGAPKAATKTFHASQACSTEGNWSKTKCKSAQEEEERKVGGWSHQCVSVVRASKMSQLESWDCISVCVCVCVCVVLLLPTSNFTKIPATRCHNSSQGILKKSKADFWRNRNFRRACRRFEPL